MHCIGGGPLRIVQVTGLISTKFGGFERWLLTLAKVCAERGHRLSCVWEEEPWVESFRAAMEAAGCEMVVMPATGRAPAFLVQMGLWLRHRRAHVMHAHFNPAGDLALLAARLAGTPLPLRLIHSGLFQDGGRQLSPRSRLLMGVRQSLAARTYTSCRTIGSEMRSLGLGGRRTEVLYLGVPPPVFTRSRDDVRREFGLAAEDVVVACVAFHDPVKGVDVLLRAIGFLAPQFPRLRLIQIGSGAAAHNTDLLKRLAQEVKADDRIVWAGLRNDVPDILRAADVYCQPSRSEGPSLAVLEAMAVGLPVVASDVGGLPETVVDGVTGLLAPPESPELLAAALGRLLGSPQQRRQMGDAGLRRVHEMFDLHRQVVGLVDRYEKMMSRVDGLGLF